MTPVQIAVMALAHDAYEIAVWGSWQKAASKLAGPGKYGLMLVSCGTRVGTCELELRNLHGKSRRGSPNRLVHIYVLRDVAYVRDFAARCAWAIAHKPEGRKHVTWSDVPYDLPKSTAWTAAKRCPGCGCTPGNPCRIELEAACGEGHCVPAGAFGFKTCSNCAREAA